MTVWTIVVAAGSGTRFGGPKQFELLNGQRVIDRSIAAASAVSDGVVVVLSEGVLSDGIEATTVIGGATRSDSVRAGLSAVPADVDIVLVHDAARPMATKPLFTTVIEAIKSGVDGAIPGVAVSDTIKRVAADGTVLETVDRSELVAVQTPQAFRAEVLRRAHDAAGDATDDAGLVEAIGGRVIAVPGEAFNIKITERRDLEILKATFS